MGYLATQRKDNQSVYITVGSVVCKIKVYECEEGRCKLAIDAPKEEAIIEREEVRCCDDRR